MSKLNSRASAAASVPRDLEAELRSAIKDLKAGKVSRVTMIDRQGRLVESAVARVRIRTGLSQSRFAELLGVSVRTLQQWEQGRREPNGAAKTLLRIAERNPKLLLEAAGL